MKISKSREAAQIPWKVPQVEAMDRNFVETRRFFDLGLGLRNQVGLKYVPPPAGTVQQLQDEIRMFDLKNANKFGGVASTPASQRSSQAEVLSFVKANLNNGAATKAQEFVTRRRGAS